jgi:hypothetical protein
MLDSGVAHGILLFFFFFFFFFFGQVIFVATGSSKVPALTSIFGSYKSMNDLNSLPAARVRSDPLSLCLSSSTEQMMVRSLCG